MLPVNVLRVRQEPRAGENIQFLALVNVIPEMYWIYIGRV